MLASFLQHCLWGDNRTLWGADLSRMNQTVFHDSGSEHPSNQANNPLVSYPLLEELEQPPVINAIERQHFLIPTSTTRTMLALSGPR